MKDNSWISGILTDTFRWYTNPCPAYANKYTGHGYFQHIDAEVMNISNDYLNENINHMYEINF